MTLHKNPRQPHRKRRLGSGRTLPSERAFGLVRGGLTTIHIVVSKFGF